MLPQSNATLLLIAGGGFSEDYDAVEGAETTKWSGEEDAYLRETIVRAVEGGVLNRVKDTRLIIPGNLKPPVSITIDDEVTFVYEGTTYTRKIIEYDAKLLDGVALYPTVRLHLEPLT